MDLYDFIAQEAGVTYAQAQASVSCYADYLGVVTITKWGLPGSPPNPSAIAAALAAPPPLPRLQAAVIAAAVAVGAQIVGVIYPTAAQQAAFQNAANIVTASANAAPSSGSPYYALFNALAAQYGPTPAAFANLIVVAQGQSLALATSEATLSAAVDAATTSAQLAAALAAFEASVSAVVAALNAALPAPMTAPAAIIIAGVNA